MSCRIKSNKYVSQKVNTIRDRTDFLALHSYLNQSFGSKCCIKHKRFVQLVKTSASFVWFVSFPLFGSFLSFAMLLSCISFLLYVCIVSIVHLISIELIEYCLEVGFRTIFGIVLGMQGNIHEGSWSISREFAYIVGDLPEDSRLQL